MENVKSTDTNSPIQHASKNLVVDMPVIIQELRSVQFGVVARGGGERLSFLFSRLLILYSPNIFLDILLASGGVSSFVSVVIFSKLVFQKFFALNVVLLLDEVHNDLW